MKKLSLGFFIFFSYACSLWAQPMADFSADVTTGCAPLEIVFTDLSSGSNLSYVWDFGDGTTSTEANPTHIYVQEASYTICLTATDGGSGQSDTECKTNYINIPTTSSFLNSTLCNEGSILVNGTLYDSNNPSGTEVFFGASLNGCDSTVFVSLNFALPVITNLNETLCEGESIVIDGNIFDQNTPSGTVVMTGATVNGCDSTINIDLNFIPTDFTTLNLMACEGETVDINGVIYDEGNPSGTQTLVSTLGCDSILTISVAFSTNPTISAISIVDLSCFGSSDGTIDITVAGGSGGYSYLWSNGSNTPAITGLSAGVYQVTVIDGQGCTVVESFTIAEPAPMMLNINPPNTLNCNVSFVVLDGVVTGGNPPYNYTWSNGENSATINVTNPGTYSLTITDAFVCSAISTIEVLSDEVAPIGMIVAPDPICPGEQVTVCYDPDMSSPDIIYEWIGPNGFTTNTDCFTLTSFDQISTECYSVTVTNMANGCTSEDQVCFPALDEYTINVSTNSLCLGDSTQLFVDPLPAVGSSLTWDTGLESLSCMDCPTPFASPESNTDYLATLIDQNGCTHLLSIFMEVDSNCVWPGDTDTNNIVNHFDLLAIGLSYDSIGPVRPNASIDWSGQPSSNWQQNTPGTTIDLKHVDTDGSGWINADDTMAISLNWGEFHLFREATGHPFIDEGTLNESTATAPFYVAVDTFMEGETLALPVILGDMGVPLDDLYGLAYSIVYDSTVIEVSSVSVHFDNSWLGDISDNMIAMQRDFYSPGKVNVSMTKIDGIPMDGFGEIARMYLTIQDDILFRGGGDTRSPIEGLEVKFEITDVLLINQLGEIIPVDPMGTTSLVADLGTSLAPEILEGLIRVFPNPAKDRVFIQSENIKLEKIILYNVLGQRIKEVALESHQRVELRIGELEEGTYLLDIHTEEGRLTKRIILIE